MCNEEVKVRKDYYKCLDLCKNAESLIDMGAGHCKYSIVADNRGLRVTAVDGRNIRIPDNLPFEVRIEDVVKTNINHDIVLLSGIFYHLDLEQQKQLLNNINNSGAKYIILNTHYVIKDANDKVANDLRNKFYPKTGTLKTGSIEGVNYLEGNLSSLKNRPLASLYNKYSFWHTEESLIQFIYNSAKFTLLKKFPPFINDRRFFIFNKLL